MVKEVREPYFCQIIEIYVSSAYMNKQYKFRISQIVYFFCKVKVSFKEKNANITVNIKKIKTLGSTLNLRNWSLFIWAEQDLWMPIQKSFHHMVVIQDEINWILFFCWWHLVFLRLAWKFVWSLSCETRKKLAKHLLTGTFLGDSIYFRIKLILAFYGIKHGKNWQWHPLWNLFLDNLNLFFASILLRIKHGKNWQNCT